MVIISSLKYLSRKPKRENRVGNKIKFNLMKTTKTFLILIAFIAFSFVTSCTKCEDEPTPAAMSTAKIEGIVYANLDLTNDTNALGFYELQWEKVPAGTKLFARINSEDLDPTPDFNTEYQDILFETTVLTGGSYNLSVYAGVSDVTVLIKGQEFLYNQKINDSTLEQRTFGLVDTQVSVIKNITRTEDLYFQGF